MRDKIKESIDKEKYDDAKILIDTDDKLPNDITLKNVVILITCIREMMVNFIHKYFQKNHMKMLVDEMSVVNKILVVSKNRLNLHILLIFSNKKTIQHVNWTDYLSKIL